MEQRAGVIGIAFVLGFIVGTAAAILPSKHRYAALRAFSDSVAVAAAAADSQAHRLADSVRAVRVALQKQRRVVITKVVRDTSAAGAARAALDSAKTASDSVQKLLVAVDKLESANAGLWRAVAIADSIAAAERWRADSLTRAVDAMRQSIAALNKRVMALRGMPKWERISFEVVKLAAVGYAGYQLGRRR